MDIEHVRKTAMQELAAEKFRGAVEEHKQKLRAHVPLLHRLFPFTIKIERRHK